MNKYMVGRLARFLFLAFLALAIGNAQAQTLVGHTKITPSGSSGGTSPSLNGTGATLIIFGISQTLGGSSSFQDSSSNSYTQLGGQSNPNSQYNLYYTLNPTTTSSMTWTVGNTADQSAFIILFGGGTYTVDAGKTTGNNAASSTTVQPGSITPSQNGEVIVTGLSGGPSTSSVSINDGFSITDSLQNSSSPNYYGGGVAWLTQTTAAAINPTWTQTVSATNMSAIISAFKFTPTTSSARHQLINRFLPANDDGFEDANDNVKPKLLLRAQP